MLAMMGWACGDFVQSNGGIAFEERRWVLRMRELLGFGFEGRGVRNAKKKKNKRRVMEKRKKSNFGESSLEGLSLFQAFAMEKDGGGDDQSFGFFSQ